MTYVSKFVQWEKFSENFKFTPPSSGHWKIIVKPSIVDFDTELKNCIEYDSDHYISKKAKDVTKETKIYECCFLFRFLGPKDCGLELNFTVYYDDAGNVYMIWFHEY